MRAEYTGRRFARCWRTPERLVLQPMYFGLGHPASRLITVVFAVGTVLHFGVWLAAAR